MGFVQSIKSTLPWWVKIGAKLVLSRIPAKYAFWQRAGIFRHGYMDSVDYAISIVSSHLKRSELKNIQGKTLLELGPGDSISTALIAKAHGANSVLIDSGPYATRDLAIYKTLSDALVKLGYSMPAIEDARSFDELLELCDARYLTRGLNSLRGLEDNSVDLVFSQAVLEHISRRDFLATQQQIKNVLRPTGVCSHRVDLRDHLGGALNNLRFKHELWESDFFANSGFYTNRLQMDIMIEQFTSAGFECDILNVERWKHLPTRRKYMAYPFVEMSEEKLNVSGFDIILRPK